MCRYLNTNENAPQDTYTTRKTNIEDRDPSQVAQRINPVHVIPTIVTTTTSSMTFCKVGQKRDS